MICPGLTTLLLYLQPHLKAAYSREVKLTPLQLEAIVKTNAYSALVEKDNVIGIQYCGEDVITHCQKVRSGGPYTVPEGEVITY